jgi:hypothetical protein
LEWKKDKVKREILTNSYENGGLKMIDIKLFCQALKMTWIKKYIDPLNVSPWNTLLVDSLEKWVVGLNFTTWKRKT